MRECVIMRKKEKREKKSKRMKKSERVRKRERDCIMRECVIEKLKIDTDTKGKDLFLYFKFVLYFVEKKLHNVGKSESKL